MVKRLIVLALMEEPPACSLMQGKGVKLAEDIVAILAMAMRARPQMQAAFLAAVLHPRPLRGLAMVRP